ncbi:MAG: heavy metal translocating P-type ATPase [Henriciella sp.]|nr:heavy metal translocating P-type ATPase [Henriciella sp.]
MTAAALDPELGCPSGLAPASRDHAEDFSAFVKSKGNENTLLLSIRGAKCGGCLKKIEQSILKLPGVSSARLNLSNGKLDVRWQGSLTAREISGTLTALGYGVSAFGEDTAQRAAKSEERSLLIAMGVAGFAAANIMLLSVSVWGGHGEMGEDTRTALHLLSGIIALPVLLFSGQHFFKSAWSVLRTGHANMDVPISLALVLAFGVSVWETLNGGQNAYFDASVMLLFFLLIGRFLDARLRRMAHAAAHDLAALQNRSVTRVAADGTTEAVPAGEILEGDTLMLSAGERAAVDLQITKGFSTVDESIVSGESEPRSAGPGATLYAGSINLDQQIEGRALGTSSDSLLSDISNMLEAGEQKRARYRKIADKAVSLYIPFVHSVAALTFVGWLILGASPREAILVAVATLIITCPCALALAAPVAQVVASGRLFKNGVYLRSGDALERLAETDHIIFDKTGTLTLGEPVLSTASVDHDSIKQAASLARASRHPLSRALVVAAGSGKVADNVSEHPGLGLEAIVDGEACRLGSADWIGAPATPSSGLSLWFRKGDNPPVQFEFEDQLRSEASDTLSQLAKRGYTFEVLSGDRSSAVQQAADALSISNWSAGVSPQQKAARLNELQQQGKTTLMIGDGLNDAGALSMAHASLAPGGAIDVSQSASDAVYSGGLDAIPTILAVAKRARTVMKQNFALAAGYNLIAVPIAVTGHVTPLIAAIAMSVSSIIVTLNALRISSGGT